MAVRTASHSVAAEARRLGALDSYRILGSEAEKDLDDIVKLAAQVWNTPIASITFVDVDRQFFKAKVGLDINETARQIAFCAHTIEQNDAMKHSTGGWRTSPPR